MRIKKKEILEALDKDKTIASLNKATELVKGPVATFKKTVEDTLGNDKEAKKIADELTGAILNPKEQQLDEEGADKVHTKKFDSCVKKVKANSDVDNPYAVCHDSLGKDAIKKSHQRTVKEVIKVKNLKK